MQGKGYFKASKWHEGRKHGKWRCIYSVHSVRTAYLQLKLFVNMMRVWTLKNNIMLKFLRSNFQSINGVLFCLIDNGARHCNYNPVTACKLRKICYNHRLGRRKM